MGGGNGKKSRNLKTSAATPDKNSKKDKGE